MNRAVVIIYAGALLLAGCSAYPTATPEMLAYEAKREELSTELRQGVDPSDGISEAEAFALGHVYLYGVVNSVCGMVGLPIDADTEWIVPIHVGYAGSLYGRLVVDKRTGACAIDNGEDREVLDESLVDRLLSLSNRSGAVP